VQVEIGSSRLWLALFFEFYIAFSVVCTSSLVSIYILHNGFVIGNKPSSSVSGLEQGFLFRSAALWSGRSFPSP